MNSFIKNISKNPFLQRSAEDELTFLDQIYYTPTYYDELLHNAINGISRMLVGKRGLGKSATIHMLFKELKINNTLPILITRYDGIPLTDNEPYFLYKIMQGMCNGIARHLYINKKDRKKLNKNQKERLSFFIELFFDTRTSEEYIKYAKEIERKKRWNWAKKIYNWLVPLLNGSLNCIIESSSAVIRKSIGMDGDNINIDNVARQYLKEADLEKINSVPITEIASWDKAKLIKLLNQLKEIANKIGYQSIVVLFDKIDEFPAINADIDKIVDFTKDLLLDTDLLYTENLSIVFSIWSDAKRALNKAGVRFDKFEDINIEWTNLDLEKLINKRLKYFTIDHGAPVTMESLIPDSNTRNDIIKLADKSPRALLKLLGILYSMENNPDDFNQVKSFGTANISQGIIQYCQSYDYFSNQSVKVGGKTDLYNWINKILLLKLINFTSEHVKKEFSLTTKTTNIYIQTMIRLELIKENICPNEEDITEYSVIDPRICYLISRGITELRD